MGHSWSEASANLASRVALEVPAIERLITRGCHRPFARRFLRLGAIAVGYTRVLRRPELRTAELDGYLLRVNVAEELGTGPYFFGDSGALWFTTRLLREGDTCVDAGANVGHYTFLMASRIGPKGRVLSFEANPAYTSILRESVRLNSFEGRVEIIERALWSTSGEKKTFYVSTNPANSGTSSLVDHGWFLKKESAIEVTTTTLDEAAEAAEIQRFRLVKIDVERAEEFVLAGAAHLLREQKIDALIVELHAGGEAQKTLEKHGYEGWLADPRERAFLPTARVSADAFGDFLFLAPDRSRELKGVLAPIARFL